MAARRADIAVGVANQVTTAIAQFAIGAKEIDDDRAWADYVAVFDQLGMKEYLDMNQQAFETRPK